MTFTVAFPVAYQRVVMMAKLKWLVSGEHINNSPKFAIILKNKSISASSYAIEVFVE